jgi:hypothetical protein
MSQSFLIIDSAYIFNMRSVDWCFEGCALGVPTIWYPRVFYGRYSVIAQVS